MRDVGGEGPWQRATQMAAQAHTLPAPRRDEDRIYRAFRDASGRGVVLREGGRVAQATPPTGHPEDLDWGHDTRAARQLAWTLLFDASGSASVADDWSGAYCEEVVARMPARGFVLGRDDIVSWLDAPPAAWAGPPPPAAA